MNQLKSSRQAGVVYGLLAALGMAPPQLQALALELFSRKASAVATNVPGPQQPLYMAGCELRARSAEHTSELQSLMRISYALLCLKKKKASSRRRHRSGARTAIVTAHLGAPLPLQHARRRVLL